MCAGGVNSERTPLLSPNLIQPPLVTENMGHFYTPMDSPDHSEDEDPVNRKRGGASSPFLPATIALKLSQEKVCIVLFFSPLDVYFNSKQVQFYHFDLH